MKTIYAFALSVMLCPGLDAKDVLLPTLDHHMVPHPIVEDVVIDGSVVKLVEEKEPALFTPLHESSTPDGDYARAGGTLTGANCIVDPGCAVDVNSEAYENTILFDPFCCNVEWDDLCQGGYEDFGGLPSNAPGCQFDCPELDANIGDPCSLPGAGDSFSETRANFSVVFSDTFDGNPTLNYNVPASLVGNYLLNVTINGSIQEGGANSDWRIQVLDPNGVNLTQGAPGGAEDEWQPTSSSESGFFTTSLALGIVNNPSGNWNAKVRLAIERDPPVLGQAVIVLTFEPAPIGGVLNDECLCDPEFDCLDLEANIGDACDDGNPATAATTLDADCNCTGGNAVFIGCTNGTQLSSVSLVCNPTSLGGVGSQFVTAQGATYSLVDVVAGSTYDFQLNTFDYKMTLTTGDGENILAIAQFSFLSWNANFTGQVRLYSHAGIDCPETTGPGTAHTLGVVRRCPFDCPGLQANFGAACDDGDENTENTGVDENCQCVENPVVPFDGCTGGFADAFVVVKPVCGATLNLPNVNANQYSRVAVVAGDDYVFSLSNPNYFVTVANASDLTIVAAGLGSVSFTAPADAVLRFYSHVNRFCSTNTGSSTSHTRTVKLSQNPL